MNEPLPGIIGAGLEGQVHLEGVARIAAAGDLLDAGDHGGIGALGQRRTVIAEIEGAVVEINVGHRPVRRVTRGTREKLRAVSGVQKRMTRACPLGLGIPIWDDAMAALAEFQVFILVINHLGEYPQRVVQLLASQEGIARPRQCGC